LAAEVHTIEIDPTLATAHLVLGLIANQQKRWVDAESSLRKYLRFEKAAGDYHDEALAHFQLGLALQNQPAKLDAALIEYNEAAKLNPKEKATFNNMGGIHFRLGKYDEAEKLFDQALAIDPSFSQALANRALNLAKQGKSEAALGAWRALLEREPLNRDALMALGNQYLEAKGYKEARDCYTKLLTVDKKNVAALNNLGLCHYNLGDLGGAEKTFSEALLLDSANAIACNNLGVVFEKQKQIRKALLQYEKAMKYDKNYDDARENYNRLKAAMAQG
jgi:tetratricopeptide (TPR) repeat protein